MARKTVRSLLVDLLSVSEWDSYPWAGWSNYFHLWRNVGDHYKERIEREIRGILMDLIQAMQMIDPKAVEYNEGEKITNLFHELEDFDDKIAMWMLFYKMECVGTESPNEIVNLGIIYYATLVVTAAPISGTCCFKAADVLCLGK